RSRPETCLSDRMLDRLITGELSGRSELPAVERHLKSCAACRDRQAELQAEPIHLPSALRGHGLAAAPEDTARPASRRGRGALGGLSARAVAAASVMLVVRARPPPAADPLHATGRAKGPSFALDVVVRRRGSERAEPLISGEALGEGDALRF